MSLITTRIPSFQHPSNVPIIIAGYVGDINRFSSSWGQGDSFSEILQRIQIVFANYIEHIYSPPEDLFEISPETVVLLCPQSVCDLGFELEPRSVNNASYGISIEYPDSVFEMIKSLNHNKHPSCLAMRHLKSSLREDLQLWQRFYPSVSFFKDHLYFTPRLFEHLRQIPSFSLEVMHCQWKDESDVLGDGGEGTIHKVTLSSKREVALKTYKNLLLVSDEWFSFYTCLSYLEMLKEVPAHPNVNGFEKLIFNEETKEFGICYELIKGITFKDWLGKDQTTTSILKVVLQLMKGLQHLENHGYSRMDHNDGYNFMVEEATQRGVVIDYEHFRSSAESSKAYCVLTRQKFCKIFVSKLPSDAQNIFAKVNSKIASEVPEWADLISATEKYLAANS